MTGSVKLTMPTWVDRELQQLPDTAGTLAERMQQVIDFSRLNIENGTGGPFAAMVFNQDTGQRVAVGVNRVVANECSSAHAEIMALSLAQRGLSAWDLGGEGMPRHQLVVNWRPCAMCYGAVVWSGVTSLVVAGSGPDRSRM